MSSKRSSDVKERLEALELVEDEEYQLRDIPQLRPQGGYSSKKIYMLTPESFKKCLMRSRKYPNQTVDPVIYCDYYLLLEKTYKLYTDYEKQLLNNQLEENQLQLEQNQQQLEENQKQLDEAKSKLRSETSKLKNQLRKTLEFNQATKKIEPTEYIYIVTTSQYQKTNKFKVGGCQSFDLIKSRLNQYNSGESDSHNHFFVYLRKTVSYKSIEHAISGMLMGFRENKSKELYFIHFDWLTKCIDAVMDGTAEFMLYVNENRDKIFEDTINMQPNISPPIQLEQIKIAYIRAGDEPKEIQIEANKFDDETIKLIREAIESYQSENNIIVRLKFEDHLKRTTNVKFEKKKRDVWKVVRQIGSALYPMWRYKY
jgi:parvulin-like peptidyl-prolyl isomerase